MVRVLGCPQSGFIRVEPNLVEICTNLRHFRYYWSLTRLKLESENEIRVRKLTQLTRVTRLDLQTLVVVVREPGHRLRRHLPRSHGRVGRGPRDGRGDRQRGREGGRNGRSPAPPSSTRSQQRSRQRPAARTKLRRRNKPRPRTLRRRSRC